MPLSLRAGRTALHGDGSLGRQGCSGKGGTDAFRRANSGPKASGACPSPSGSVETHCRPPRGRPLSRSCPPGRQHGALRRVQCKRPLSQGGPPFSLPLRGPSYHPTRWAVLYLAPPRPNAAPSLQPWRCLGPPTCGVRKGHPDSAAMAGSDLHLALSVLLRIVSWTTAPPLDADVTYLVVIAMHSVLPRTHRHDHSPSLPHWPDSWIR